MVVQPANHPTRNPPWSWDEILLACALVAENGWRGLRVNDPRVIELSELLRRLPIHEPSARTATFRNPNSVQRKTFDIATRHHAYTGVRTHGSYRDQEVLDAFLARPEDLAAAAERIREGAVSGTLPEVAASFADELEELEDTAVPEGRLLLRRHLARERNRQIRRLKIRDALGRQTGLTCEVCGFDFEERYGERGAGYIECHHVVPLHEAGEGRTRLSDLALVCANCHRIIHRRSPWLTPSELRDLVMGLTSVRG